MKTQREMFVPNPRLIQAQIIVRSPSYIKWKMADDQNIARHFA